MTNELALATALVLMAALGHAALCHAGEESAPARPVRLALMQTVPEKWNLDANFEVFLTLLEGAAAHKPDFFITPEGWLDGYAAPDKASTPERILGVAQDLDTSPYLQRVAEEAKDRGLYICFGFTSLEDGKAYNAAGLWGPDGKRIGVYHKTHIQTHDVQYAPGEGLPVWPTDHGPVGIMICADRRWPETARTLRLQGARLILNPTYGFYNDMNTAMMRTRAYENQCFVAFTHPQLGLVTDPKGRIAGRRHEEPGVLICDIDLARAKDDNHLRDRRPELYDILTQPKR
ncbi:MAG: carbon-nitrogen hydrolase family protein [bacterium]|nr:carbon-nitrogen hydrolase family protein [bacterium]